MRLLYDLLSELGWWQLPLHFIHSYGHLPLYNWFQVVYSIKPPYYPHLPLGVPSVQILILPWLSVKTFPQIICFL